MWIGNHSYTHPHLIQESQSQIDSEISRTQTGHRQRGRRHAEAVPPAVR